MFWIIVSEFIGITIGETEVIILIPIFLVISVIVHKRFPEVFLNIGSSKSTQTRDEIVGLPQFKGSVDRKKGVLQATARMVTHDSVSNPSYGEVKIISITRLRAELLDDVGNTIDYIPVEIRGESAKWVGTVVDGDRIRVKGKFGKDGNLHAKGAFNYSTNSYFGEK